MVKIIQLTNGLLFDATGLEALPESMRPGYGINSAKKMFMPKDYPAINNISLFNDRVVGTGALGRQFDLTTTGANGSFPISQIGIEGALENTTSLDEIFNKFIAIL
jgi:hypothetical protein